MTQHRRCCQAKRCSHPLDNCDRYTLVVPVDDETLQELPLPRCEACVHGGLVDVALGCVVEQLLELGVDVPVSLNGPRREAGDLVCVFLDLLHGGVVRVCTPLPRRAPRQGCIAARSHDGVVDVVFRCGEVGVLASILVRQVEAAEHGEVEDSHVCFLLLRAHNHLPGGCVPGVHEDAPGTQLEGCSALAVELGPDVLAAQDVLARHVLPVSCKASA